VFCLDAFKIAREVATDPDLQLRMQGIAFQGGFFAASPVMQQAGLDEPKLLDAIRSQLQHKFGGKGARIVEENMQVVRRGFDEIKRVPSDQLSEATQGAKSAGSEPDIPVMIKTLPQSKSPATDIHRFWEQTGNFYSRGMGNDNLTDPFIGLGVMPASSALFRDMTGIRFQHPEWIAENCTACAKCYTVCPDTAIPGLVNEVSQVLDTTVKRLRARGEKIEHLPRAVRLMERHLRKLLNQAGETDPVKGLIEEAIDTTITASNLDEAEKKQLESEFKCFREELGGFQFALSRPYYTLPEKDRVGDGGLLSITVNPYTCKGCMECVEVCDDDALRPIQQTTETVEKLRSDWNFWLDLPTTPDKYSRIDNLEEGIGALESLLLDKTNYLAFSSGDGACLGCAEKTVMHLFTATVEALMQPRIAKHMDHLDGLIDKLQEHLRLKLVEGIDLDSPGTLAQLVGEIGDRDVTLASIAERIENEAQGRPIDQDWLRRMTGLLAKLKQLKWRYTDGTQGRGRSKMGLINSTGCTSVWGSTYPFNPYPFPWANHLFQDSTSMSMGVFEGHMAKMAEGFKAIRISEVELAG
jgi:pyruvate-ferredoxin/flavodoxin oxidoreductase